MAEVKVDGAWLHSLGAVSGVSWGTRWGSGPCGPDAASCEVAVTPGIESPLLRIGRPFEVWSEGVLVFGGPTVEPARGFPWKLNARGWASRAGDFDALDASYNPTTNPRTAVTQAIARGLEWTNPDVFPDDSIGEDGGPNAMRLDALLDLAGVTLGKRWGTDAYGVAFWESDPTTPTYSLDANGLDIGTASDGLYTRVLGRYVDSVDGTTGEPDGWDTEPAEDTDAQDLYGAIEYPMDLTPLLQISSVTAASHAAAQLALLTVPQWLNGVSTDATRLRSPGGLPASLRAVRAGEMIELRNVPNTLGPLLTELSMRVVLSEVRFEEDNPASLYVAPSTVAVRNLADLARQAAETAQRQREAQSRVVMTR